MDKKNSEGKKVDNFLNGKTSKVKAPENLIEKSENLEDDQLQEEEAVLDDSDLINEEENVNVIASQHRDFYIVALGGSAGSYESIEAFIKKIPVNSGVSIVVIQHLDPEHKSILPELLQRATPMEVLKVEDGMKVQPNKIYVIPENREMAILQGTLLLFQNNKPRGRQMAIDTFFESLALDWGDKAACVIFSGMGSDGEVGCRFIKESVGLVMVQDPQTAKFDSMPLSAIKTGLPDYIDTPENLALKLLQYIKYPVTNLKKKDVITEKKTANGMQKVFHLLRAKTGHDFSLYKSTALFRRFERKMHTLHIKDMEAFANYLQDNPNEVSKLFKELLIGVTKFFRDFEAFKFLEEKILPELLSKKGKNEPLRIWVTACSTGEEAYSIAILIKEIVEKGKLYHIGKVQLYATDLDTEAINKARSGIYFNNIIGDISPERIQNFFDKVNENQYQVKKEIREMVIFAEHNIVSDPSFINFDLLCCRNLLIYFSPELQKKLMPVFHFSLKPRGILFLGSSETIGGHDDLFITLHTKWKFYEKRENASSLLKIIDFPSQPRNINKKSPHDEKEVFKKTVELPELVKRIIIEKHTPPTILINFKGDLFYIIGRTGKFLEPAPGHGRMNIFEMAREGLSFELRSGLVRAAAEKTKVVLNRLKVKTNGDYQLVKVTIDPVLEPEQLQGFYLIIFEELPTNKKNRKSKATYSNNEKDKMIEELEQELKSTKTHLQQTMEEMETSLEELKSTNEELQSTNEELQSTNEESNTAKEEMYAMNEELMSVNFEIRAKTDELNDLNNDMINLFNGVEIAIIFLDNFLNIKRYTPMIEKIIKLVPADIGRPVDAFKLNLKYDKFKEDVKEVIDWLAPLKRQVQTLQGKWYEMNVLPYRTIDNFIDGAVVTFNDIDELKKLEHRLENALHYAENIINSVRDPIIILDKNLNIKSFNKSFSHSFLLKEKDVKEERFDKICNEDWNIPKLLNMLQDIIIHDSSFNDFEVRKKFSKVGHKSLLLNARLVVGTEKDQDLILLSIEDKENRE